MDPEEDIYVNIEGLSEREQQTSASAIYHPLQRPVDGTGEKKPVRTDYVDRDVTNSKPQYRLAAMCLGLLCLLLLSAVIAVSVCYDRELINHTTEKEQLLTSYQNLTEEREQLQRTISDLKEKIILGYCPVGWRRLRSSCYLLSTEKNNWSNSRQDCLTRGADLAIINGREEQEFINQLGGALMVWIGLTDSEREGAWRWVDGTPLTVIQKSNRHPLWLAPPSGRFRTAAESDGFWRHNEPNDAGGREDCVSFNSYSSPHNQPIQSWNDEQCSDAFKWLCEGVLKL